MPSLSNTLAALASLLAISSAAPTILPRASECPSTGKARLQPSALYNVFPSAPNVAKKTSGFHVETYNNASQVEQLLVFNDVPADAKDCSIGWAQGERPERIFIVKGGDALTEVKQLSGFPDTKSVTYETAKEFDTADETAGAADFTNWDDLPAQGHIIGAIDCKSSIYLKAALRNPDGNTKVYLEQNSKNGLYIEYSC
ncbi:hypothetical protein FVEN_g10354 [Fusarium venenatum]|uniref:Ubiquitin 3 binding protein But2 C-terminal domain-containing protein n=1 Tax=Fusarium venenatum TaxID=56646 RepID=A0A2L2TA16_9HYPO|nr:uncharacterized protein FVRRES_06577 [Fusarium venenatum]KAG8351674.1 hypothetical protein FVEN_g10354 [Fusarium venenatum]CEI62141.1 unnamed protein product [Fusarium venenatum]